MPAPHSNHHPVHQHQEHNSVERALQGLEQGVRQLSEKQGHEFGSLGADVSGIKRDLSELTAHVKELQNGQRQTQQAVTALTNMVKDMKNRGAAPARTHPPTAQETPRREPAKNPAGIAANQPRANHAVPVGRGRPVHPTAIPVAPAVGHTVYSTNPPAQRGGGADRARYHPYESEQASYERGRRAGAPQQRR